MVKVLLVCLGNICRSPTADAVLRQMVVDRGLQKKVLIDSAGTGDWHIGHPPDRRASATAARRGYDMSVLRARQVTAEDFLQFDHILAMDDSNYRDLTAMCPSRYRQKIQLFLQFAPQLGQSHVPDPYYGGDDGFEQVLDMVEAAAIGLLNHIESSPTHA